MKVLVVTSRVHFVPNNYRQVVETLVQNPNVVGVVVVDNLDPKLLLQAFGLFVVGATRIARSLFQNFISSLLHKRLKKTCDLASKNYWILKNINSSSMLEIVEKNGIDLVLNARTRVIYKKKLLESTRLGCINVHHGLLPDQRGTMCDLWALADGGDAGFSIHKMNKKIDDGEILKVCKVASKGDFDSYFDYLQKSAEIEASQITALIEQIVKLGNLPAGISNKSATIKHYKNPNPKQIKQMRKKGLRL